MQVKDLMQQVEQSTIVQSNQSLLEAVMLLEQQRSALPVIQDNGVLVGILEKASILNLLQKRAQANPA
jgi:CBS-domain-containing membrane protein